MTAADDVRSYYSLHGLMTDPRDQAGRLEGLPTGLPALCKVVQGLLIHPMLIDLYGVSLTPTQRKEISIRPAAEILRLVSRLDPRPLSEQRLPNERVVGNCRDHALLLCAFLRSQNRPARVRAGFARYLGTDMVHDHWITEVWEPAENSWIRVDPQLDEIQRKSFKDLI